MSNVAGNLRRFRGEMSLAEASRLCGVSAEHISLIERGLRHGTQAALEKIAKGYGKTLAEVFAEPPEPQATTKNKRRRAS